MLAVAGFIRLWRHGVVPLSAPWVAAGNSFQGQPAAFEQPVFLQRLGRIMRTGRGIPAFRTQQG